MGDSHQETAAQAGSDQRNSSPIRPDQLTWQNTQETPVTWPFPCSLAATILHRLSPNAP
jgi:hypothetical protein